MTDDAIWEVFDDKLPLLGATYGRARVRMVAMGLRDGGLVVWSPGVRADAARAALEKWGTPRFLLAPNHFHNAGLAEWKRAYPEARIVASEVARPRLRKQVKGGYEIEGLDALLAALPDGVRVFGPPMAQQGETWLAVEREGRRTLVVCDAIVNFATIGWQYMIFGFRARLMTNPFFKRMFLKSKARYRKWMIDELTKHPPSVFIPSHGEVMRGDDVADKLREATRVA